MTLITEPYSLQSARWSPVGQCIHAQFDSESIIVYQAYNPKIGHFAAEHGYFGGTFKFERMSWIKPNFLWMMYRSGWGTKQDQEVTLAIHLRRDAFDDILNCAVYSTYKPDTYANESDWKQAVESSDVRLQWDPDHDLYGNKLKRRAIQLGLRGETLAHFSQEWILRIEDISAFVAEQRSLIEQKRIDEVVTPSETPYLVTTADTAARLQVSACSEQA